MTSILADVAKEATEIHVYRTDAGEGPAWLFVLVFAIAGALFAVTMLILVMLLRRARARRANAVRRTGRNGRRGTL